MPRPEKCRFIGKRPCATIFKPAGIPARELEAVTLTLDCFEAIRLVDLEGCDHAAAAERLRVSRPTLTRILKRGRSAIAESLVYGKAIIIEGGTVTWGVPPDGFSGSGRGTCPGRRFGRGPAGGDVRASGQDLAAGRGEEEKGDET